jgi:hypothetical protein
MAESIKTLVLDVRDTVAGNSGKTVDKIPLIAFECLEYLVLYKSSSPSKRQTFKILLKKDDTGIETQVYAKGGDYLDIAIDGAIVGGDAELQVTNNEAFSVDFVATRLIV